MAAMGVPKYNLNLTLFFQHLDIRLKYSAEKTEFKTVPELMSFQHPPMSC